MKCTVFVVIKSLSLMSMILMERNLLVTVGAHCNQIIMSSHEVKLKLGQ